MLLKPFLSLLQIPRFGTVKQVTLNFGCVLAFGLADYGFDSFLFRKRYSA